MGFKWHLQEKKKIGSDKQTYVTGVKGFPVCPTKIEASDFAAGREGYILNKGRWARDLGNLHS